MALFRCTELAKTSRDQYDKINHIDFVIDCAALVDERASDTTFLSVTSSIQKMKKDLMVLFLFTNEENDGELFTA